MAANVPPGRHRGAAPQARSARAAELDEWLGRLLRASGPVDGIALVAVGGLGRRECLPHADLDLVLVHDGHSHGDIAARADAVWYPIWDAKLRLDHSVRTVSEAVALADADVKVALGLLDARHVAGDRALAERLRQSALTDWRRAARHRLPALRELTVARWEANGELAFLLEGDVKQARGGLRDVAVLRGIGYAQVAEAADPAVRQAGGRLLDVRHALRLAAGRGLDRLLAEQQAATAALLDLPGRDELARQVAEDARTVSYALDDAWRAVDRWLDVRRGAGGLVRRPLADGVVECGGEVMLARDAAASVGTDPTLPLRVAAAAATNRLPIARATLRRLAEAAPPLPDPWPARARHALLALLGSGDGLVGAWEAFDRYGLVQRWLPEWQRVRSLPQRNPAHLYTVDRHLVQTAAHAAGLARGVSRPDLLLLAALLHDIGKGLPGDHSQAGLPAARQVCSRLGLAHPDTELVCRLVRHHLLLADTATRRDLSDPATIDLVADAVVDAATLDLLHALTRADAAATGPAAWSAWKSGLIADLVGRVRRRLDTGEISPRQPPSRHLMALAAGPLPAVRVEPDRITVAARDPTGLLASVAGVLAAHRLEVLSADAATIDGTAVVECVVTPRYGRPPEPEILGAQLRRAVTGRPGVVDRVTVPDRIGPRAAAPRAAAPHVVWLHEATSHGTVLELRAADSPGLLCRVAYALEQVGAAVRAARVCTLGNDVVDSFYLTGDYADPADRAAVEAAVLTAAHAAP